MANPKSFLKEKKDRADIVLGRSNIQKYLDKVITSRYDGVCFDSSRQKWVATIGRKFLGRFASESEALAKRKEAEKWKENLLH